MTIRVHTAEGIHVYPSGVSLRFGDDSGLVEILSSGDIMAIYPAGSFKRINRVEPQVEKVSGEGDYDDGYEAGYAAHVAWAKEREQRRQATVDKAERSEDDLGSEQE